MEEQCCKFVKKASKIDEDVNAPARSNKNGRGYDGHIRWAHTSVVRLIDKGNTLQL
jgi:hypothetical protein